MNTAWRRDGHRRPQGYLAGEIAAEATEMTVFEDFVQEKIMEGRSILGLYPPTAEQARIDFAAWRKAAGR